MSVGRWVAGMVAGAVYSNALGLFFQFNVRVPIPWNALWVSWVAFACISILCAGKVIAYLIGRSTIPKARKIVLVLCCCAVIGTEVVHATLVSALAYQVHRVKPAMYSVLDRQ